MAIEDEDGAARVLSLPEVQSRLNRVQPQAVLDLGCGDALCLALLYHSHGPKRLVGVERWSEEEVLSSRESEYRSLHEAYLAHMKFDDESMPIQNAEDFRTILGLQMGLSIEEYLRSCSERFDLVICSDVLHYIGKRAVLDQVLWGIRTVLSEEGLFFLRVIERPGDAPGWSELEDYRFDELESLVAQHLGMRPGYRQVNCRPHNSARVWAFCNF